MVHEEKKVAVLGTYGLVGQWLVRKLLERGYVVHSAIGGSPKEASEMMKMPGAERRLHLFLRDLLDYANIANVMDGCSAVFLTISPCDFLNGLPDYPAEAVDAEVRGTLNVVEACANTPSVKRLLITSSASAVVFDTTVRGDKSVDERSWSNLDFLRKNKIWSALAKTVAEKAAWSLARDRGVDLVVLNPAIVVGPKAKSTGPNSIFSHYLEGQHSGVLAFAHADAVADAHIVALETSEARGRYLCFERLLKDDEVLQFLKRFYPNQSESRLRESYTPVCLENQKLLRLGVSF